MITDRVFNLNVGDDFIYMGTKYRVTIKDDRSIYYSAIDTERNCIRNWWTNHFGVFNQMRVEIIKKIIQ